MNIGTTVMMVNCAEAEKYKDRIWTTRSKPWLLPNGERFVLLEGYSDGFPLRCLHEIEVVTSDNDFISIFSRNKRG